MGTDREGYFLAASRMVPYKRMPLIVEAFAGMRKHKLIVIGDGPDLPRVRETAAGHGNIEILGHVSDVELVHFMRRARAFVFAAEEDFGIAPVEAMASGTPVIAFGRGGARDTVIEGSTGLFFNEQSAEAIQSAVERFVSLGDVIDPVVCRQQAERFSEAAFRLRFFDWVSDQRVIRTSH